LDSDTRDRAYPRCIWAEVEKIAVGTDLQPEELPGLHRTDVDRQAGVLHVRRRFTGGMVKEGGTTDGSVRAVPLRLAPNSPRPLFPRGRWY